MEAGSLFVGLTWNIEIIAARMVGFALGSTCIRVYSRDAGMLGWSRSRAGTFQLTLMVSAGLVASVASMAADIPETV